MQPNVPEDWDVARYGWRFWLVVVTTGVGAGLGAALLMLTLRTVQHLSYHYHSGLFQFAVERTSDLHRVLIMLGAGLFAGIAWLLLRRLTGRPVTSLSSAVWQKAGKLDFVESIANAFFQIIIVGMGASLGREGAPKEAGAAVASKFSQWAGMSSSQRRLLVACGAGAGMAAVYNVPLGGALFALEVLLGTISLPLVLPALATSLIATAVAWIYVPDRPTYSMPGHLVSPQLIVWALIFGPIAGVVGVGYIRLIAWANRHRPEGWHLVVSTTTVLGALGALAIVYPQLLGNGRDIAQLVFVDRVAFPLLVALTILKPLATAGCLRSGAKGGLFTPTLSFGALLGAASGAAWLHIWPGAPVAACGVIGAAAILAAAMQGPLCSIVLVLELTHHGFSIMVPLLLAVVSATVVCRMLEDRSVYSAAVREHQPSTPAPEPVA